MGYLKSWNGRRPERDSEVRHKIELREERHLSDTKITRGYQERMQFRAHGTCIVAKKVGMRSSGSGMTGRECD